MAIETAKLIEQIATNCEVAPPNRVFAAGILHMSFECIRFSDVQRPKSFEVNSDSALATLLTSKTKKLYGIDWHWAFPRMGMTVSTERLQPISDFRVAHAKRPAANRRPLSRALTMRGNSRAMNQLHTPPIGENSRPCV